MACLEKLFKDYESAITRKARADEEINIMRDLIIDKSEEITHEIISKFAKDLSSALLTDNSDRGCFDSFFCHEVSLLVIGKVKERLKKNQSWFSDVNK
jgi:hypothetical protein